MQYRDVWLIFGVAVDATRARGLPMVTGAREGVASTIDVSKTRTTSIRDTRGD